MPPLPLSILFEDNYLLALDKPAGLQVERDRFGNPSLEAQVAGYFQKNYPWKKQLLAGVAHRLDRQVSGVVLFAKTPAALKSLGAQFEARTVGKFYLAAVEGKLPQLQGELTHWLGKDLKNKRATLSHAGDTQAKECRLRYRVLEEKTSASLVEIELLTGRYHQIRAQLSAAGCPVLGDEKYGWRSAGAERKDEMTKERNREIVAEGRVGEGQAICLHALRLSVQHPKTGERMEFSAPPPKGWLWESLARFVIP